MEIKIQKTNQNPIISNNLMLYINKNNSMITMMKNNIKEMSHIILKR